MSTVQNLDAPCPLCDGKPVGEHTVREWAEHADRVSVDLPYEETPGEPVRLSIAGENVTLADTIVARSCVVEGGAGIVGVALGCLLLDFQIGDPDAPPRPVARIGYVATPDVMRKVGRMLRDTADGAANATERSART